MAVEHSTDLKFFTNEPNETLCEPIVKTLMPHQCIHDPPKSRAGRLEHEPSRAVAHFVRYTGEQA